MQMCSGDNQWSLFWLPCEKELFSSPFNCVKELQIKWRLKLLVMLQFAGTSIRRTMHGNTSRGNWTTLSPAGIVATGENNCPVGSEYANYKRQIMRHQLPSLWKRSRSDVLVRAVGNVECFVVAIGNKTAHKSSIHQLWFKMLNVFSDFFKE